MQKICSAACFKIFHIILLYYTVKIFFFIFLAVNAKEGWLYNVYGVYLVNVSWLVIGQQGWEGNDQNNATTLNDDARENAN
jgi:hypothetical protein